MLRRLVAGGTGWSGDCHVTGGWGRVVRDCHVTGGTEWSGDSCDRWVVQGGQGLPWTGGWGRVVR